MLVTPRPKDSLTSDLGWLWRKLLSYEEKEEACSEWVGRIAELGREDEAEGWAGLLEEVRCDWKEEGVVESVRPGVDGE
jgi:hypothetical protein